MLWGFNYSRLPVEEQLGLELKPLTFSELKEEFAHETEIIKRLRNDIPGVSREPVSEEMLPEGLEKKLRAELETWLGQHGFSTAGRVRGRYVLPKGIFLRFSSSGLYFPFTGEGHIDAGLHALQTLVRQVREGGTRVLLAEVQPAPRAVILSADLHRDLGPDDLPATLDDALAVASRVAHATPPPSRTS